MVRRTYLIVTWYIHFLHCYILLRILVSPLSLSLIKVAARLQCNQFTLTYVLTVDYTCPSVNAVILYPVPKPPIFTLLQRGFHAYNFTHNTFHNNQFSQKGSIIMAMLHLSLLSLFICSNKAGCVRYIMWGKYQHAF